MKTRTIQTTRKNPTSPVSGQQSVIFNDNGRATPPCSEQTLCLTLEGRTSKHLSPRFRCFLRRRLNTALSTFNHKQQAISMRKLVFLLGVILISASSLLGCNPDEAGDTEGTASSSETIKIGAILPLTGDLSAIGEGERRGLLMAVDSVKARHPDHEFELIIEDFASETQNAVSAANKLLNVNDVDAIITSTTAASEAVSPVLDSEEIPHFVISPDLDIVKKADNNYRVYYNFRAEAKEVNEFIESTSPDRISYLAAEYSSIQKEIENIIDPFAIERGIETASKDFFPVSNKNFRTPITRAKSANPDLVFLAPQVPQVELLTDQLYQNDFVPTQDRKFVASFTFNWRPRSYLKTLEDFYIASPRYQVMDTTNAYAKNFSQRFDGGPNFDTMYAYDNLIILSNLLVESVGSMDKFKKLFNNNDDYVGASGKIEFVGNRDTNVEIILTHIEDGKQAPVGKAGEDLAGAGQ